VNGYDLALKYLDNLEHMIMYKACYTYCINKYGICNTVLDINVYNSKQHNNNRTYTVKLHCTGIMQDIHIS